MAKQIDNSYVGNQAAVPDLTSGTTRTNPQAHNANNALKLYGIRKFGGCSFTPTWTWAYAKSGNTLTMTPTAQYDATGLRFWKYRIIDENGNEAAAIQDNLGSNDTVVISTASLNPLKCWRLEFSAETLNGGLHCGASWWIEFPEGFGLNATASGSGQTV